jgi:plasmanylethanolamine desaturase
MNEPGDPQGPPGSFRVTLRRERAGPIAKNLLSLEVNRHRVTDRKTRLEGSIVAGEPEKGTPGKMTPQTKAVVDRLSVALFAFCWIAVLVKHVPALIEPDFLLAFPLGILAGYLLADFLAGGVHWLADRFFDPETPLLGPMLIAPFREHHVDPGSIGRHDFFEVSGNNALVTTPVVLLVFTLPESRDFTASLMCIFGISLTLALVATNQFHGWAHAANPPAVARALHTFGLVLTPERHAEHHLSGFDRAYCVTSGWLNPLLDRIQFFDRIERGVSAATQGGSKNQSGKRSPSDHHEKDPSSNQSREHISD